MLAVKPLPRLEQGGKLVFPRRGELVGSADEKGGLKIREIAVERDGIPHMYGVDFGGGGGPTKNAIWPVMDPLAVMSIAICM